MNNFLYTYAYAIIVVCFVYRIYIGFVNRKRNKKIKQLQRTNKFIKTYGKLPILSNNHVTVTYSNEFITAASSETNSTALKTLFIVHKSLYRRIIPTKNLTDFYSLCSRFKNNTTHEDVKKFFEDRSYIIRDSYRPNIIDFLK